MTEEVEEPLLVDRLCSGDRPSVLVAGMVVAEALRRGKIAVLMADSLGRVQVMPPDSIQVLRGPRLLDEDLHKLSEEGAIQTMVDEGRTDVEMTEYLRRRDQANA